MSYYKTEQGINVLQTRSRELNARQRRLLVLIGTEDYDLLNENLKQRFAPAELIDQLCEMGLIASGTTRQPVTQNEKPATETALENQVNLVSSEIRTELHQPVSVSVNPEPHSTPIPYLSTSQIQTPAMAVEPPAQSVPIELEPLPELRPLAFEDVQYLMMSTLQKYCGLMAKQQIDKIRHASDIRTLKQHQMQWITSLQESRIQPQELNLTLKQINLSLDHLQRNYS